MPSASLFVDGNDLSDQGFYLRQGLDGLFGSPIFNWPSERPPGRIDAIHMSVRPEVQTRTLLLPGALRGSDRATLRDALRDLGARLDPMVEHTFRVVDDQAVQFTGEVREIDDQPIGPDLSQLMTRLTVRVDCTDPRLHAVTEESVALSTSFADTPLGTAPIRPVIRINGPATDPLITYADATLATVEQLSLLGSIADGDWVEVDCAAMTIVDQGGANQMTMLDVGTFIELNPQDGDYVGEAWPKLKLSSGTGTATYPKSWWMG